VTWQRSRASQGSRYWLHAAKAGVIGTVQFIDGRYRMYLLNKAGELIPIKGQAQKLSEAKKIVEKAYDAARTRPIV